MERLVKGDVVVLPFPFTDLSSSKRRPALVAANIEGDDLILCQITSESRKDSYSINLLKSDFRGSGLKLDSVIRPNRLFTASKSIISYKVGELDVRKIKEAEDKIINIFKY